MSMRPRSPLAPQRMKQPDFFICDVFDAIPKSDMASMEHPIFALGTQPDLRIREYEHNGNSVRIIPSALGMATVHDKDILIYCISQLMTALNRRQEVTQTVRFRAKDLLIATNRNTAGTGYAQLKAALERLRGTTISTNITTGGQQVFDTFGLVDRARVVREREDGRMQEIEVKLSDWVFNAIEHNEVLTINRDYFRLRKPLERRLYEIARKHCGKQGGWKIGLGLLQHKCGSVVTLRDFRKQVVRIVDDNTAHQHLPDYSIALCPETDMVSFESRTQKQVAGKSASVRPLDPNIYDAIRFMVPGCDVYALEQEWRAWTKTVPRDPEMAFLGFCRKRAEG